jgi:hypothetical protein
MTTPTRKPAQITLDTLPQLFAYHRERFGGFTMVEGEGGEGGGSGDGAGAGAGEGAGSGAGAGAGAGGQGAGAGTATEAKFTQADLDRVIADRLAKEKTKFDAQLKELQDNADKTEVEKLTAERDKYKQQVDTSGKTTGETLAKVEAKVQALVVGGRDDRLTQIIAAADLSTAYDADGTVDEAKVKAAIEKVLTDFPEWKKTPGKSGGELGGGTGGDKPTFTRKQIEDMTPEERVKRLDELNEAMAEGRITG